MRMIVDLPRLRARNSPRLIASYKVVRPEREAEQASLTVSAIGAIWFDIRGSPSLAGNVPAVMPMFVIGPANMASLKFRKKLELFFPEFLNVPAEICKERRNKGVVPFRILQPAFQCLDPL
jgi:hypothetical protein